MECPINTVDGADLLIAYSAGRLSEPTTSAFKSHLESCNDCRTVTTAQAELWSVLDSWEPLPVSPDFDRKLYARIAAEEEKPWYRKLLHLNWSFRPAMPVAAACAALLAAFLLKGPILEDPKPEASMAQSRVDIEKVERALDDIDMLKQLGVVTPPSSQGAAPRPM